MYKLFHQAAATKHANSIERREREKTHNVKHQMYAGKTRLKTV